MVKALLLDLIGAVGFGGFMYGLYLYAGLDITLIIGGLMMLGFSIAKQWGK